MEKLAALPIDWANVNWNYVVALVLLVFVCTFVGTALSLGHTIRGCVLTAPSVRYGISVLDLLPARPAAADVGQGAQSCEARQSRDDKLFAARHPALTVEESALSRVKRT
jgi:hypothetical protein